MLPPDMYTLRPDTRAALERDLPYPLAYFYDPDDLGRGLTLVEDTPHERLFRFNSGALVSVQVRGTDAVALTFYEGEPAVAVWIARGMRLLPERTAAILAAVRPGALLNEALTQVWGPNLRGLVRLDATTWRIDEDAPLRCAVLEVTPKGDRVERARIVEGREAYDRVMAR